MPTYDYHCQHCGYRFEARQKMTDDPLTVCPKCAGQVHRVIHPTGIVFKGAGFYKTDHRPSAGTASEPAATAGASSSAGESGGESTPAKATEKTSGGEPAAPAARPADGPAAANTAAASKATPGQAAN